MKWERICAKPIGGFEHGKYSTPCCPLTLPSEIIAFRFSSEVGAYVKLAKRVGCRLFFPNTRTRVTEVVVHPKKFDNFHNTISRPKTSLILILLRQNIFNRAFYRIYTLEVKALDLSLWNYSTYSCIRVYDDFCHPRDTVPPKPTMKMSAHLVRHTIRIISAVQSRCSPS